MDEITLAKKFSIKRMSRNDHFHPGNIFSEKFPSFFTLEKILMIHDSFWGAHVSFCCKGDILESDTILVAGKETAD